MRPLSELVNVEEPGIQLVREWTTKATNPVEILPGDRADGERNLLALQVTTRSPMGAIAYETGGILVDFGWLRILGAGSPRLPRSLADWNGLEADTRRLPGAVLIGDDALGGFFAANGGALPGPAGNVFYFAPDSLRWADIGLGYSQWVYWACVGKLELFYKNFRWQGWEKDVAHLRGDQGISVYPFLWANAEPIADRQRRPAPIEELWRLHTQEMPKQLVGVKPGEQIRVVLTNYPAGKR
jgi:hypothetical protein